MRNDKAPFTITHHGEALSWCDSSLLKALAKTVSTVLVTTLDGDIYEGEVLAVENGILALSNSNIGNAWAEMEITLTSITNIHYC
jgi:predicted enzyme involved in methoxymalonyl-ACP biosynthesis